MYEEQLDGGSYTRLDSDDFDKLNGKRITAPAQHRGKVCGWTNADGEEHPAIIHIDGADEDITPEELPYVDFDGRHGFMDI